MERRRELPIVLTSTQSEVGQSVINALKSSSTRRLVVLQGLSGVGKTATLDLIRAGITLNGGRIVEYDDLLYSKGDVNQCSDHFVTTSTVGLFGVGIAKIARDFPSLDVVVQVLPGMNEAEIAEYVSGLPRSDKNSLSSEQIAQYSLGIPLLAQRLSVDGITEEIAQKIAASYLSISFWQIRNVGGMQAAAQPYLRVPVERDIFEVAVKSSDNSNPRIFQRLYMVLQFQSDLAEKGITEESPLFVAPESEGIYDAMLKSDNLHNEVEIFVPRLRPEAFARLQQAFGHSERSGYRFDEATRPKMFGANDRKVRIWHRDTEGKEVIMKGEMREFDKRVRGYEKAYREGELGLTPEDNKFYARFLIHVHDHPRSVINVSRLGWAAESLLQQRGIKYFVNNRNFGASYVYNPDSQHIEMKPSIVQIET